MARKPSGSDEKTTCPVSRISSREPRMTSWVACPARSGIAMSFLPHTMSVGADSSAARLRRSCAGVAKLRHSPVAVDRWNVAALGLVRHAETIQTEHMSSCSICGYLTVYLTVLTVLST